MNEEKKIRKVGNGSKEKWKNLGGETRKIK